jgi:GNAT superfamily N-acetyltransferase
MWIVMRMDDNGNTFVVAREPSREEADRRARELESLGHKQTYWVERAGDVAVRRVGPSETAALVDQLVEVLIDCVAGGASVSFMHPLSPAKASSFWRQVMDGVSRGERALLVAEEEGRILGTVQLVLAQPENQPHRADVAKLLVHRSARGRGIAVQLMEAIEATAREEGKTLLVLDAVTGGDAARLYARLGWQRVGDIPSYALMPDGTPC